MSQCEDVTLHILGVTLLLQTLSHAAVIERVVPLISCRELGDELQANHRLAGRLQLLEESPHL